MEELYKGKHSVQYSQVALFDAEDTNSYPQFETGEEAVIFGSKGVAVATANDTDVEIAVLKGEAHESDIVGFFLLLSGEMQIGNQGLIVGNEITADTAEVAYPAGKASVSVYANAEASTEITGVLFILNRLE
jgi:hypothetical protein